MCYDPIGQGERYQMLDFDQDHTTFHSLPNREVPHPRVQYHPTVEHTVAGLGCVLTGSNVAQYRIWDGMRSIDYLQSRSDIIPDKIGCTGNSGGGTMTAYLMALDTRIVAAAPACFLTTYRKLIDTRGAQDAEQNIFGQVAFGMDEPDYVMMTAPRPVLICAATRDVTFDIQGTWDLFRQSKRFYTRMGYPERVSLAEADALHGFTVQLREAAVHWMKRWLLGIDEVVREVDPGPDPLTDQVMRETLSEGEWTQEELYCSPGGQVLLMPGEKSVFRLNGEMEKQLEKRRSGAWRAMTENERRDLVRRVIGADAHPGPVQPMVKKAGEIRCQGYTIEKLVMTVEDGMKIPALAFVPDSFAEEVCLYVSGTSAREDAGPGGPIEERVMNGQMVLAAELRGIGETETGHDKRDYGLGYFGRDVQEIFLAYLIGRSYVGMRVEDIRDWTAFLLDYRNPGSQSRTISVTGTGEAAIPVLHTAAIHPGSYVSVHLTGMVSSWSEVVQTPHNMNQAVNMVHGVLKHYDLPDLVVLAGPHKVRITDPVDASGNPAIRSGPHE